MKKLFVMLLCIFMWSSQGFAACVSTITASTPTADFTDHGNGTVTHSKTGLMWKQCSEGLSGVGGACTTGAALTYTWQAALQLVETLNGAVGFATYTDWRVPNIKELASIVEEQCSFPAINEVIFPAIVSNWSWSSSPYAATATGAWAVYFNGGSGSVNVKSASGYVRLVRGGQ
ncbi:MAG: DUF1566 domain-containing protein [Mariprofundaceae bacterium]